MHTTLLPPESPLKMAFTLVELLVVIAIIAILAAMLLPGLTRAKMQGQSISCMSNLKQLNTAWLSYAGDNRNWMPPNWIASSNAWIDGVFGDVSSLPGATNLQPILLGLLYPYCPNYRIYQCPACLSGPTNMPQVNLVRTYSMEGRMGGANDPIDDTTYVLGPQYPLYWKLEQVQFPGPSRAINFVDESINTVDDGYFAVEIAPNMWQNSPTSRHMRGAQFGFADGHSEYWPWKTLCVEQEVNVITFSGACGNTGSDLQRVRNAVFLPVP